MLGTNFVSPRSLSLTDDTFYVDSETAECQEKCLNGPELLECDRECAARYPQPDSQGLCVRFCTRNIYICLKRCANLDTYGGLSPLEEQLGRTKEPST